MRMMALVLGALALSFVAGAPAIGQQSKQTQGPQEQPGPFRFPGVKHMTETLSLTFDQAGGLKRIYSDYQKKEHQAQQEAAQEAAKDKTPGSKPPRADTKALRDEMITVIQSILNPDQKKKFDDVLSDLGKKKKNNNN